MRFGAALTVCVLAGVVGWLAVCRGEEDELRRRLNAAMAAAEAQGRTVDVDLGPTDADEMFVVGGYGRPRERLAEAGVRRAWCLPAGDSLEEAYLCLVLVSENTVRSHVEMSRFRLDVGQLEPRSPISLREHVLTVEFEPAPSRATWTDDGRWSLGARER